MKKLIYVYFWFGFLKVKRNVKHLREDTLDDIWDFISHSNVLKEDEWNDNITAKLKVFEAQIIKAMK